MCLIAVAYRVVPAWPLLVLANRDEFYARPAAPLAPWGDGQLLAGQDLEAGGTWLGVHTTGRFSAVTNVTETPPDPLPPASRGALVEGFLKSTTSALDYLTALTATHEAYRGFNLLTFDGETLAYGSNRGGQPPRALAPGCYALANAGLESAWPKQQRIAAALAERLAPGVTPAFSTLRPLLYDQTPVDPDALVAAGLAPERFGATAQCFLRGDHYGTRASTLVALGEGALSIEEARFGPGGRWEGTTALGRERKLALTGTAHQGSA